MKIERYLLLVLAVFTVIVLWTYLNKIIH